MTDVYVSYSRQDRDRVRLLCEMLQFEGWDVWMDPSEPTLDGSAALDLKLGSAGAILVVWSPQSRASEYVRSEAATGLYKNKLIQARLDHSAPPKPFDQLEVVDMGLWSGERDDPNWRRITAAVRLYAGAPGSSRPQVTRRAMSGPAYLEPSRSVAWGPIIAAGLLVAGGAGVWFADPFGWRSGRSASAEPGAIATSGAVEAEATIEPAGLFEDSDESLKAWAKIDRKDPDELRAFVAAFPRASGAETGRSLLRVMDAQAWVNAVTSDNESAYQAYLKNFPVDGATPGAMAAAARDRLVSLSTERTQAIEEIQRGLTTLKLYRGNVDGKGGDGTAGAIRQFASSHKMRNYPTLSSAAPRDLRALADAINNAIEDSGKTVTPAPQVAAAVTPAPAPAAVAAAAPPPVAKTPAVKTPSATDLAAEADRQRIAQAQLAASKAVTQAATQAAAKPPTGADALAQGEMQKLAEQTAWNDAEKTDTIASYRSYLTAYPTGSQVAAARSAITRLNKPAGFSLDLVSGDVKAAAEAARKAQQAANARAAAARDTAAAADRIPDARSIVAADGDHYEAQISGGAPNGLGVRVSGKPSNAGDRYRGQLRNGQSAGLGVYEFSDNPNNAGAGALRYEGEHSGDASSGYGVTYWKNGDTFAGQETSNSGQARGVLTFSNGQRYEGEVRNGVRNGVGVVWGADGSVVMAGRWDNGKLVEPMTAPPPQGAIQLTPSGGGE